eukprot:scaffold12353_cov119-Isochrysis_galbana.AAC.2
MGKGRESDRTARDSLCPAESPLETHTDTDAHYPTTSLPLSLVCGPPASYRAVPASSAPAPKPTGAGLFCITANGAGNRSCSPPGRTRGGAPGCAHRRGKWTGGSSASVPASESAGQGRGRRVGPKTCGCVTGSAARDGLGLCSGGWGWVRGDLARGLTVGGLGEGVRAHLELTRDFLKVGCRVGSAFSFECGPTGAPPIVERYFIFGRGGGPGRPRVPHLRVLPDPFDRVRCPPLGHCLRWGGGGESGAALVLAICFGKQPAPAELGGGAWAGRGSGEQHRGLHALVRWVLGATQRQSPRTRP